MQGLRSLASPCSRYLTCRRPPLAWCGYRPGPRWTGSASPTSRHLYVADSRRQAIYTCLIVDRDARHKRRVLRAWQRRLLATCARLHCRTCFSVSIFLCTADCTGVPCPWQLVGCALADLHLGHGAHVHCVEGRRLHTLPLPSKWLSLCLCVVQGTDFSPNVFQLPLPDLVPLHIPVVANKASTDEEG